MILKGLKYLVLIFGLWSLFSPAARAFLTSGPGLNSAPPSLSAKDDVVETFGNTSVVLNIVGNDRAADMGNVDLIIFSQPLFGLLSVDENGRLLYSPMPGFVGNDSFYYLLQEGKRMSMARVLIFVKGDGKPPIFRRAL